MTSIRANRQHWNLISGRYQAEHDPQIGAAPRLWTMSAIPDARLHALTIFNCGSYWVWSPGGW